MDTNNLPKTKKQSVKNQAHVRFTDKEFARVVHEAAAKGMTVPCLLKESYFEKPPLQILMPHEDQKKWVLGILQVGNDLTTIRRLLTAGLLEKSAEEIEGVSRMLDIIMTAVLGYRRQA